MFDRQRIESTLEGMASYIRSTADYDRDDRLWPAHYLVFSTNPLSVAYGASGITMFLNEMGSVPAEVRSWLLDKDVSARDYPPGLYVGMAGIAYSFFEIGLEDRAQEIMKECYASALCFDDPTMFFGAAGWGLCSLYFYRRTGLQLYLDRAAAAADFLLKSATPRADTLFWRYTLDDYINYGYGYGAAGIALFLLQAGQVLGRDDLVTAARSGLDFDLSHHQLDRFGGWTWSDHEEGHLSLPYWGHGSAGVGTVVVRFYEALGEERYRSAAETIAESAFSKWSVLPSLVMGLSGVGAFMLDVYRATGDTRYRDLARSQAETVLWYAIERDQGITFPGRWLRHISNDYATGAAGIGLFLSRLLHGGGQRRFVDVATQGVPKPTEELVDAPLVPA